MANTSHKTELIFVLHINYITQELFILTIKNEQKNNQLTYNMRIRRIKLIATNKL